MAFSVSTPEAYARSRARRETWLHCSTLRTIADPKGVMLTHANLLAEADAVFAWAHIGPDNAILGVLPLFHVLSQMANLLLPLVAGTRVVYLSTLNTTELLRALRERNITAFAVVPQFFNLIHERIFKEVRQRGTLARFAFPHDAVEFCRQEVRIQLRARSFRESSPSRPAHALPRNRWLAFRS